MDWEQSGMVQNEIFWIQRLDFEYTQLLPSPVLKNLKLWTLGTPLVDMYICWGKAKRSISAQRSINRTVGQSRHIKD